MPPRSPAPMVPLATTRPGAAAKTGEPPASSGTLHVSSAWKRPTNPGSGLGRAGSSNAKGTTRIAPWSWIGKLSVEATPQSSAVRPDGDADGDCAAADAGRSAPSRAAAAIIVHVVAIVPRD